jgi:hypothetical protein
MKSLSATTRTATPQSKSLINQPTSWPLFYILPQTHYVKRQRAANSPQYDYRSSDLMTNYEPANRKLSFLDRCRNRIITAKNKAWISLKQLGRKIVHALVKWYILPLTVAACFSMIDALPAELPESYSNVESATQVQQR